MKIESIENIENAISKGEKLPYIYIRNLSDLYVGKTSNYILDGNKIDEKEVIEVSFFDNHNEIKIVKNNNLLSAIEITKEDKDDIISKIFKINNKVNGKEITVDYHIDYDEDGQAFIQTKRLADWRE